MKGCAADNKSSVFSLVDEVIPYQEGSFILKYLEPNGYEYRILCCDYPVENDECWRFWIECGDKNGEAKTTKADLTESEQILIKNLVIEELKRINQFFY